ncbi:MAG: ABC transporter ATP-binding protein [Terriglobales bacterium]
MATTTTTPTMKATPPVVLELSGIESGYGEVQVLWGISLKARAGKLTTIIGANGAGKTTTLRTTMGSLRPWKGRVLLKGEDVSKLAPHAKAARGLVLVPEGRQLFPDMSVEENLEMGAYSRRARPRQKENLDRVYQSFPRLKERRKQRSSTLSGGEQQMLAMGRGLMQEPVVLMIDELSLGLAPVLAQQLFLTLKTLKEQGITIVLVEQNVHLALAVSDYTYVLAEGRVPIEGESQKVASMDEVRRAYLGL